MIPSTVKGPTLLCIDGAAGIANRYQWRKPLHDPGEGWRATWVGAAKFDPAKGWSELSLRSLEDFRRTGKS